MSAALPFHRRPGNRLAFRYLIAALLTVIFVFPVYWLFIISFKTPDEIFAFPPLWYPKAIQFANYRVLFKDGDAATVGNSLILASVSTFFAMILGTIAVTLPHIVNEASFLWPEQIAVSVDVRGGKVATQGWTESTDLDAVTVAKRFEDGGVGALIITDIDRDGTVM